VEKELKDVKSTVQRLLDRVGVLRNPCDLDLVLFFSRHPRVLITSEDLARFVGYDLQRLARSLDALIAGGIVRRSQNDDHAARMYFLESAGPAGGWLPSLLGIASRREGRAAIIADLATRSAADPTDTPPVACDAIAARRLRIAHT
jgi:hypothetical protein